MLEPRGCCWDLSDAYKQVPLSDEAFHLDSYLGVYDPSCSSAKIFKQCVLPFASIASITAFLRVSLALWQVGSTLLHLMWSVYFDDFLLCLARSSESRHVDFCADALSLCWGGEYPNTNCWSLTHCAKFCVSSSILGSQVTDSAS